MKGRKCAVRNLGICQPARALAFQNKAQNNRTGSDGHSLGDTHHFGKTLGPGRITMGAAQHLYECASRPDAASQNTANRKLALVHPRDDQIAASLGNPGGDSFYIRVITD